MNIDYIETGVRLCEFEDDTLVMPSHTTAYKMGTQFCQLVSHVADYEEFYDG